MNTPTIRAIETRYNGYRFRSRLEARWAVFFDTLGVKYEYEPEGYVLSNGTCYLPDFYLPDLDCFVEIKGQPATDEECTKAARLSLDTGLDVFLFDCPDFLSPTEVVSADGLDTECGPKFGTWGKYFWGLAEDSWEGDYGYWGVCPDCIDSGGYVAIANGRAAEEHMTSHPRAGRGRRRLWSSVQSLDTAFSAARSARFEFGESGAG